MVHHHTSTFFLLSLVQKYAGASVNGPINKLLHCNQVFSSESSPNATLIHMKQFILLANIYYYISNIY